MKWLILFAFAVFVAAQLSPEERTTFLNNLSTIFNISVEEVEECINSTGTTDMDILQGMDYVHLDKPRGTWCLTACCLKKGGLLVGRRQKAVIFSDPWSPIPIEIPAGELEKIRDILNECNAAVNEEISECNSYFELGKCIKTKCIERLSPDLLEMLRP